jgi:TonB family protein
LNYRRSIKLAILLSLIFHVALLFICKPNTGVTPLFPVDSAALAERSLSHPITFELVETPESAQVEKPVEDALFLSDKNTRAQDMYQGTDLPKGLPYSEGTTQYKIFAGGGNPGSPSQSMPQSEIPQQDGQENTHKEQNRENELKEAAGLFANSYVARQKFSPKLLYGSGENASGGSDAFTDGMNWDNRNFSADALGGVSLSTYAWDFAPYIYYMKKRLRDHIYPPPAFYSMGAISGEAMLRFKLFRDGRVENLELLNYTGHKALAETSLSAVKASSPFKQLPKNFPDEFLELTWTFIYSINQ